tara:strand:+ start:820 stop:1743 length:924 start_codon:yes stop_codon:yes gene_type:complete
MAYDSFTLNQNRFSEVDSSGNIKYRIDITCIVATNPAAVTKLVPEVFVYSTDTTLVADVTSGGSIDGNFLRVATVADLSSLPVGLEDALATNVTAFRSRSLQLSMPDLETAVNAIPVIVDRVNTLVSTYITYQENFYTELDSSYSLPRATDATVVSRYSTAYTNSVAARSAADLEKSTLNTEYQSFQIKTELLTTYVKELEGYRDSLSPVVTAIGNLVSTGLSGEDAQAAMASLTPHNYKLQSLLNLLIALCSNRNNTLISANAQESIKLSDLKNKEEEITLLQANEAQALKDLATYCPQIDATSLI